MGRALAAERVRRDVEVLARAGLDLVSIVDEALSSLQRAVAFDSVCIGTMVPSTGPLTGTLKLGNLQGVDEHDHERGLLEFGTSEPTSFAHMAARGVLAAGVRAGTVGGPEHSVRVEEFMRPHFGFGDELRALCLDERGRAWAGVANQVMRTSLGAEDRLAELTAGTVSGSDGLIGSLVGAARRYARDETTVTPRSRIPRMNAALGPSGWFLDPAQVG